MAWGAATLPDILLKPEKSGPMTLTIEIFEITKDANGNSQAGRTIEENLAFNVTETSP